MVNGEVVAETLAPGPRAVFCSRCWGVMRRGLGECPACGYSLAAMRREPVSKRGWASRGAGFMVALSVLLYTAIQNGLVAW